MARYQPRHASTGDPVRDAALAGSALRDRLTREWLAEAVGEQARIVGYDAEWWDGTAHERCLVVDLDGRRLRVVDADGEPVIVPSRRRQALRVLASRRRPAVPRPRGSRDRLILDATGDVVRCGSASCGALRPVDASDPCPVCGRP